MLGGEAAPVFYNYIKFDGAVSVMTNYMLPDNAVIVAVIATTNGNRSFVGVSDGTYITGIHGGYSSGANKMYWKYNGAGGNRNTGSKNAAQALFLTPTRGGNLSETRTTFTASSNKPNAPLRFGWFDNSISICNGSIGVVQIFGADAKDETSGNAIRNNHTPIAVFRPCTYKGQAGFWHEEEGIFYGKISTNTGTMIATDTLITV